MHDFCGAENYIITEKVRTMRLRIKETREKIGDIKKLSDDAHNAIILQDLDNACNLLGRRALKLGDRLRGTKEMCNKINKLGQEMDGNTSNNEEEEFVIALIDEMPQIFTKIDGCEAQLAEFAVIIQQCQKNKDSKLLMKLKDMIDDLSRQADEIDDLANSLETELIEWNAQRKLIRRDEEIDECEEILRDIGQEMEDELAEIQEDFKKQKQILADGSGNKKTEEDV